MTNNDYEYATCLMNEIKEVSKNIKTLEEIRTRFSDVRFKDRDYGYYIKISTSLPVENGELLRMTDYDMECFIKHEEDVLKDLNDKFAKI